MEIDVMAKKIKKNIQTVIMGKSEIIDKSILCILCCGHILFEDVPGTGKTTLVKALAKSLDLNFKRVQFTPDLLPADLSGVHFFDQKEQEFVFRPGPIFTNILLADEINRATPRTQSSLLECMEEKQVTVDGETRVLDAPFFVTATQNPIEIQGTFPLPEAQLDRFFMRLFMGYPDADSEKEMLTAFTKENPLDSLAACVTKDEILDAQEKTRQVFISDEIKDYIIRITSATRVNDKIRLGVSPRGSLALMRASQAVAIVSGRDYVIPDDVKSIAADVLSHRILCKAANHTQREMSIKIINQIVAETPAPTIQ